MRAEYVGNAIHVRALLNFSSYCARNCLYCGLRQGNAELTRYRMQEDEIVAAVRQAAGQGYRTIVMQSGEDPYYTEKMLCRIIGKIKASCDIAITLSPGERPYRTLKAWFQAGADRYLLKHETSDPALYKKLHPDLRYKNRIRMLKNLKEIGYQTGSGIMIGLPGQTYESVANDILLFRELDIDMIGCGPYIHNPKTPLSATTPDRERFIQPEDRSVYKVIALTRIVTRDTMIPATTALSTINPVSGAATAFKAGANVLMVNVTPEKHRTFYEIYPRNISAEGIPDSRELLASIEKATGRKVSKDYGHRPSHK
jgi:biotin synthase